MFKPFLRGLRAIKENAFLHFLTISTVAVSLLLLSGVFLLQRNMMALWNETNAVGLVFVSDNSLPTRQVVESHLSHLTGVRKVRALSQNELVHTLCSMLGISRNSEYENDAWWPHAYEIVLEQRLSSAERARLVENMEHVPFVTEVDLTPVLAPYRRIRTMLSVFLTVVSVGVLLGGGILVANFMSLRNETRRRDFMLGEMLGATRWFMRKPILMEGAVEGGLGACLALGVCYLFCFAAPGFFQGWGDAVHVRFPTMARLLFLSPAQVGIVVLLGIFATTVGAVFSSNRLFLSGNRFE